MGSIILDAAGVGQIPGTSTGLARGGLRSTDSIRFTQDSISTTFRNGRPVGELVDGLRSGRVLPDDIPPIRIFEQDNLTYTLDNRRLFAADQAGVDIQTIPATAEEIVRELPRKFTTPNEGTIIGVRGTFE